MGWSIRGASAVHNQWDPADKPLLLGGLAAVGALLAACSILLGLAAIDVWSGVLVFLAIISLSVPMLRWVARKEGDPWLFKVFYTALIAKLAASLLRYFVIFVVYAGNGDAGVYSEAGVAFARRLRDGRPIHPLPVVSSFPRESHWIADITGVVYAVTGPSAYAGFFVFSLLCFWGQVVMVRALKAAVPEADYRRYALLVMFLPSLLFWPSSIGKEALLIGCLGLVIYGGALLLAPKPRLAGIGWFGLGLAVLALVRPHIAYMSIGALGVAVGVGALRSERIAGTLRGRAVRLIGLAVLLGAASVTGTMVSQRFAADEQRAGSASTQATLQATLAQTSTGGSEFVPPAITNPTELPLGVASVLFRPMVWEARSVNALIAATEGVLLLGLFAVSWRRVGAFFKLVLRRPFLVFALGYVLVFAVGFSYLANFGILARQRTQMMPMVLVLLAIPAAGALRDRRGSAYAATPDVGTVVGADSVYAAASGEPIHARRT